MSSFFEFNVALTGLFAAQHGMNTTANNITNAGTKGYSRQVLNQQAQRALSGQMVGMVGTGVVVTGIERVRNTYLDSKLWGQNARLGEYTIKVAQNSLVEAIFGEPNDDGFTTVFNDFFNSIDDLSNLPTEGERKAALKQTLISFTKYFNSASESLTKYQQDLNFEVKAMVQEVNMLATRIASLNKEIYQSEMQSGHTANNLRDDRERCIDRLSQLINVDAREVEVIGADGKPEKQYVVKANGQTLVDHYHLRTLDVKERATKLNPEDADGLYDVVWSDGIPFKTNDSAMSGELKGALDMRDGRGSEATANGSTYNGIPYYIKQLDNFVRGFAQRMNEVYQTGAGANANEYELFSYSDGTGTVADVLDYSLITAANFRISADITDDLDNIRTNTKHNPFLNENPEESNNDLLMMLLSEKDNGTMFKDGNPKDYMISLFSELGINTQEAKMYLQTQTNITNVIENQRLAVSQVDTNEEFMNLVKYNQAYQAAAKIMNTIDEIYDLTINRLGS
jgi:flagellar hook-associated protein 1 FlgK